MQLRPRPCVHGTVCDHCCLGIHLPEVCDYCVELNCEPDEPEGGDEPEEGESWGELLQHLLAQRSALRPLLQDLPHGRRVTSVWTWRCGMTYM